MGCGSSSSTQADRPQPPPYQEQPYGWGQPGYKVTVAPPNQNDPPFMRTVAPSGTTWSQYVRTGASFIDPSTGHLGGPWAECVSWAVIFEKQNDWANIPEYAEDGPAGGVMEALEQSLNGKGDQQKKAIMEAADRLEKACHAHMDDGSNVPQIQQLVTLPQNAIPGQSCQVSNFQQPGTMMTVQVPPNAQPGQPIMAQAPVQPTKEGMSTGGKVALAAGGVVVVGALAGAAYYGLEGGGVDGFMGDVGAAGGAIGDAGGAVGDWAGDGMADVGEFAGTAVDDVGGFIGDLF